MMQKKKVLSALLLSTLILSEAAPIYASVQEIETNTKTELVTADSTIEEAENSINEPVQETEKEIAEDGEKNFGDQPLEDIAKGNLTQITEESFTPKSEEITPIFSGGDGSATNPYLVADATDFDNIRNDLNAHYKLVNNITLSGGWTPIGTSSSPFRGNLDGGNHTISGLFISAAIARVGLFAYANGASFKNLTLNNIYVNSTIAGDISNRVSAGGLVAYQTGGGEFSNIRMNGGEVRTSTSATNNYVAYIGGMIGYIEGESRITDCSSSINAYGTRQVGSLIGYSNGATISKCYATGNVLGDEYLGGLAGNLANGIITNSYATGNVSGRYVVGGMIGSAVSGTGQQSVISDSYATGNVSASGSSQYQVSFLGD
ncbi:GLUG motif-containing protein [Lactococcus allomyrinae]|uniref:GLUG domain-containing protein n=1 Tax=Lactococcus allomyrinae TaxID=2419773 RepID=A0A387BQV8_9LACT|nr:GLUG motif-containing protein [Lactococcus allomyrinae]AYG00871.1 hypothetical protein D7I46_07025 [Lactococcus allomyrinae]